LNPANNAQFPTGLPNMSQAGAASGSAMNSGSSAQNSSRANCPVVCPPGWNWCNWGGNGCILWNGANYVVYWNGYPVPPYVPGPFGGMVYLYDPNLLPGAMQNPAYQQQQMQAQAAPQPTQLDYAVAAFRAGQNDLAVKLLTQIVAADKDDAQVRRLLAL